MLETRVRIAEPFGADFLTAPHFLSAQVVWPFRDSSTLNIHYPDSGVNSDLLNGECEAVFEYWNGTTWVEPFDSRFRLSGTDKDRLEDVPTCRFDFMALIPSMLKSAYVWEDAGLTVDADGNIVFAGVTPGLILRTLITNAKTRGWAPGITLDFNDTADSNGAAWANSITLTVRPEQTIHEILTALGNQGIVDWAGQGRTLRVFNPDSYLGRDRTSIRLLASQGETSAPEQKQYGDRATVLRVVGENGAAWDRANGTSPWGRLESIMSAGGVADEGTAYLLSDEELLKSSGARVSRTREFDELSQYLPQRDYRPGDYVSYQTDSGMETMRVFSVSLNVENRLTGYAVLGDRFEDALIAAARKQSSLVIGGTNGGNGKQPTKDGDTRTPAAPTGFLGSSSVYIDPDGNEVGRVSFAWAHTGKATDGTVIDIDRFEFRTRESIVGDAEWVSFRSVPGADRVAMFSPVAVRAEDGTAAVYDFAIRAVAANSRYSPWVNLIGLLMETDTVPPPVPSAPVGVASYGQIIGTWDGLGSGGEPMPPDFLHTEYEIGSSTSGPWQFAGNFERAGAIPTPFKLDYGTYWLRLRSVDRVGNKSAWSSLAEVTTTPLVDLPDVHDLIDQINQDLADALDQVGVALNSANGKNKITHSTSAPSITGSEVEGDVWFRYSNSEMNIRIGSWQFTGGAWVEAKFGHQILDSIDLGKATVGMLDGVYIKTKSLNFMHAMVGDFTNLSTIDPLANINVTVPAGFTTVSAGGYTYKADGGSDYLMFLDQTGPVPFESGDWLRVSFDAISTTSVSVPTALFVYPNLTGTSGSVSATGETVEVSSTEGHYSFDIQVPDLTSIGGGRSWILGLTGPNSRAVGVKNVRVYKKTNATLISPDSIRTPHLGADIIEGEHIKSNTIETDNMVGGFADFITITGSIFQTVDEANRGIKIASDMNAMYGYNSTGDRVFYLSANTGNMELGKGAMIVLNGSTGDLNIGNGKFLVNGSTGNVTMDGANLTAANITGHSRVRIDGSSNGGYSIAMNGDELGGYLGFWTPETVTEPDVGGTIRCNTTNSTDPVGAGMAQMVLRSPRIAGVSDERCSVWLMSNDVDNGAFDQPVVAVRGDIRFTGNSAIYGGFGVTIDADAASTLDLGVNAGGVRSTVIRDRPYTGTANVYVTENGYIGQTSSSGVYKLDQRVETLPDGLLDIPVKTWIDKTTHEESETFRALGVRNRAQQMFIDSGADERRIAGVVAEDVAEAPGGDVFVTRDIDGSIRGVAYDRLAIAQIQILTRKVRELESRIN